MFGNCHIHVIFVILLNRLFRQSQATSETSEVPAWSDENRVHHEGCCDVEATDTSLIERFSYAKRLGVFADREVILRQEARSLRQED